MKILFKRLWATSLSMGLTLVTVFGSSPSLAMGSISAAAPAMSAMDNPFALTTPIVLPDEPVITDRKYSDVDAGSSFVCGIRMGSHQIDCWGLNDFGQATPPDGRFKGLSLGEFHGCAIRGNDGHLVCWGLNDAFAGANEDHGEYISVSSGDYHTCAIEETKAIKCWGSNDVGQGNAPKGTFTSLSAKAYHTCATRTDGKLLCWGDPGFVEYNLPAGKFKEVATGRLHGCALTKTQGGVICWGNNLAGATDPPQGKYIQIASGSWHSCGLRDDHAIRCRGEDLFGQTSWVDAEQELGVKYKKVVAGGQQSCGLTTKGQLRCHGSFAFNSGLFSQVYENAQAQKQIKDSGGLQPRWVLLAGSLISNFVGLGLQTYGKAADKPKTGTGSYEARAQKGQWALMGVASVLNFLGASGPDPVLDEIRALQADVDRLREEVRAVDLKLSGLINLQNKMWCDQSIALQNDPIFSIKTAKEAYLKLIEGQILPAYSDAIQKKKTLPDPVNAPGGILDFMRSYEAEIREAMTEFDRSFVTVSTPAVEACRGKGIDDWRKNAQHPFDDRLLYKLPYALLNDMLVWQTEGLILLQEINLWNAYIDLTANGPVKKVTVDPAQLQGFCDDIRKKAEDKAGPSYARYAAAASQCNQTSKYVHDVYLNMVQEVEMAGAPYTDDTVILSMSEKKWNVLPADPAAPDRDWLWLRDFGLNAQSGKPTNFGVGIYGSIPGTSFDYYRGTGKATWNSDGQAWLDVFRSTDVYRKSKSLTGLNDLITDMATTKDSFIASLPPDEQAKKPFKTLFNNVTGKVFWLTQKEFEFNFVAMLQPETRNSYSWSFSGGQGSCSLFTHQNDTAYCFAGSAIGRICGADDESILFQQESKLIPPGCNYDKEINVTPKDGYWDLLGNHGVGGVSGKFLMYASGSNQAAVSIIDYSRAGFIKKNLQNSYLADAYLMPVLNVADRPCSDSMVNGGGPRQPTFKVVTGGGEVAMATRCGADMDEVLRTLVPRPIYPDVPEVRP